MGNRQPTMNERAQVVDRPVTVFGRGPPLYTMSRQTTETGNVKLTIEFGVDLRVRTSYRFGTVTVHKREDVGTAIAYMMDAFESMVDEGCLETFVDLYLTELSEVHKNVFVDQVKFWSLEVMYRNEDEAVRRIHECPDDHTVPDTELERTQASLNANVAPVLEGLLAVIGQAEFITGADDHDRCFVYNDSEYAIEFEHLLMDFPVINAFVRQRGLGVIAKYGILRCDFSTVIQRLLFEYGFIGDGVLK